MKKIFKILKNLVLLAVFVFSTFTILRFFAFDVYYVPSASMSPTIHSGEYILTNKMAFGMRWFREGKVTRLPGTSKIKRNDIVVFNFPEGDTVYINEPTQNYYFFQRLMAAGKKVNQRIVSGEKCYLPIPNRVAYVKRCVALPGDTLKIDEAKLYINGTFQKDVFDYEKKFRVDGETAQIVQKLEQVGISRHRQFKNRFVEVYALPTEMSKWEKDHPEYKVRRDFHYRSPINIFPLHPNRKKNWNDDHYGPLYIPKAGDTIILNSINLPIYSRLISVYEGNDFEQRDSLFYINNIRTDHYIIKQNYYFMMGDNRYGSMDSRKWGFVPEDHLIGKAQMVLTSKSKEGEMRWNRFGTIL